jgi:hypothetical protein
MIATPPLDPEVETRRTEEETPMLQRELAGELTSRNWSLDDMAPPPPSPLVGLAAGVLLSVALWLFVGCAALVLRLLGVG